MAEEITDVVPSDTSDNEGRSNYLAMKGLIISSDLEGNVKPAVRTKKSLCQKNLPHLHQLLFLLLITLGTSNVNALISM